MPHIDRENNAELTDESGDSMQVPIQDPPPQRPKLIDIRFAVDLVFTRFYIVLMVGKDRRDQRRTHSVQGLTKVGNMIAAVLLLLGVNLTISAFLVLSFYLIKSMLGINLTPGHLEEYFKALFQ
jgi:hypothetical protein